MGINRLERGGLIERRGGVKIREKRRWREYKDEGNSQDGRRLVEGKHTEIWLRMISMKYGYYN